MPSLLISTLSLFFFLSIILTHQPESDSSSAQSTSSSFPNSKSADSDSGTGAGLPKLPRFAYLIAGTKGDGLRLKRLLQAVYHPRNYYLLHLDLDAPDAERIELAKYVRSEAIMKNVMVIGKPNLVTYKGPTMIACTLHAVAVLLKQAKDWDWFINLSASDYPLMPQDG